MSEHPELPITGIADVDAALASVADLDEQPVAEHLGVFEGVHAAMRRTLDDPPAHD